MIRLLALDLDGTLMNDDMVIKSARVRRAIAAAQAQGVVVTLATGRMLDATLPFARELDITAPLICYQGALIQSPGANTPLYRATMAPALLRKVLEWGRERGEHLVLYAGEDVFLEEKRFSKTFYREMLGRRLVWVDDLVSVLDHQVPIKFVIFVESQEASRVRGDLQSKFDGQMELTRSHEVIVEGNPLGVSKGGALSRLAARLEVPQSRVMAIGDQDNDISMVAWAGVGVAMGNGSAATKAAADWVAPSVEEDGAAVAIERFVLNAPSQ